MRLTNHDDDDDVVVAFDVVVNVDGVVLVVVAVIYTIFHHFFSMSLDLQVCFNFLTAPSIVIVSLVTCGCLYLVR